MVRMDNLVKVVHLEDQEIEEVQDNQEKEGRMEFLEEKAIQDRMVYLELLVLMEDQGKMEILDYLVLVVPLDLMERKVLRVIKVIWALKEKLEETVGMV